MQAFILTSYTPGTPVHNQTWRCIQQVAKHHNARILVGLSRNNNKSTDIPATLVEHIEVSDFVMPLWEFRCSAHILQTQHLPLSVVLTDRGKTTFIPSPKAHGMFTPTYSDPIMHASTGSVSSDAGYPQTITGDRAKQSHSLGGLLLMDYGTHFQVRQLTLNMGRIEDLSGTYYPLHREPPRPLTALLLPDIHAPETKRQRLDDILALLEMARPSFTVMGDIISFGRYSHHVKGTLAYANKGMKLQDELKCAADFVNRALNHTRNVVISESNHHDHILQWVQAGIKPRNLDELEDYALASLAVVRALKKKSNPFNHALLPFLDNPRKVHFPTSMDDFSVQGVRYFHGHYGPNGARGNTLTSLAKLPFPTCSGHSHTPGWRNGAYVAGVAMDSRDASYTRGASSWYCSAVMHYSNNTRSLVNLIQGRWV